jgi:hypothetical protein
MIHIDAKAYNSYSGEEIFSLLYEGPSHQFQKDVCPDVTRGVVAVTMSLSMVA